MSAPARLFGLIVAIAAAGLGLSSSADAFDRSISFCNRTTSDVDVALGVDLEGTSDTTTKGWYQVRGCTCLHLLHANLRATEIFLLATRSGFDNVLQGGRAPLCVHPSDSFSYLAENASQSSCNGAGGKWVTFKWYDTGTRSDYRLNLRREGECNLMDDQ